MKKLARKAALLLAASAAMTGLVAVSAPVAEADTGWPGTRLAHHR